MRDQFPLGETSTIYMSGEQVYSIIQHDKPGYRQQVILLPEKAQEIRDVVQTAIQEAEQRGAIKALRDTADHIENEIEFVLPNRYKPLRFRRNYEQDGTGLTPEEWLRARADQMEGDE